MLEIEYKDISNETEYLKIIEKTIKQCYAEGNLPEEKVYICVTLTDSNNIRQINKEYRGIDKATDVLSFPMFEKEELEKQIANIENEIIIGDIVISIEKVKEQAIEFGHSFEREIAYMVVHGFFHLMGYDHIEEQEKNVMRQKEETVLKKLDLAREE